MKMIAKLDEITRILIVSRRNFLEWTFLGVSLVALVAIPTWPYRWIKKRLVYRSFDPSCEYGFGMEAESKDDRFCFDYLLRRMKQIVPPQYRNNVQLRYDPVYWPHGRMRAMAWYYEPGQVDGYLGPNGRWIFSPPNGIYIWSKA